MLLHSTSHSSSDEYHSLKPTGIDLIIPKADQIGKLEERSMQRSHLWLCRCGPQSKREKLSEKLSWWRITAGLLGLKDDGPIS